MRPIYTFKKENHFCKIKEKVMMIAISKDICVGDFCQALPQEVPTQLGIIDEIQSIANSLFLR